MGWLHAFGQNALAFWVWLDIDLSAQTLVKSGLLAILVIGVLVAIAVLYRGEFQNRDQEAVLKQYEGPEIEAPDEMIFTKSTLDIKTQETASKVKIFATFPVRVGDKIEHRRRKVYSGNLKVKMRYKAGTRLRSGEFGFHKERHTRIAGFVLKFQRQEAKRAEDRAKAGSFSLQKLFSKREPLAWDVGEPTYAIKMNFPVDPIYLLTAHPDREVKTNAWLTLLTSFFAIMMQIFFGGLNTPERASNPAKTASSVVRPTVPTASHDDNAPEADVSLISDTLKRQDHP